MAPDMQARMDAFTFLTDEWHPHEPWKWLVVWRDEDGWDSWSQHNDAQDAEFKKNVLAMDGITAQVYDLDNQ